MEFIKDTANLIAGKKEQQQAENEKENPEIFGLINVHTVTPNVVFRI